MTGNRVSCGDSALTVASELWRSQMRTPRPAVLVAVLVAVLTGLTLASVAEAQTVVVPNQYTSTSASTSGLNTFIRDVGNPRTGQLLIAAAELTTIPIGQNITGMTYRLFTGATVAYPASAATWTDYTVNIGPGGTLPGSTTFANNFTSAPTMVRTGAMTIPLGSCPGGGNPNAFCTFTIPFTTPFQYNGGNLCIEVRHTGSNITNNAANDFLEVALTTDPNFGVRFWSATAVGNTATTGAVATYTVARISFTVPVELFTFSVE
jgi:hypothetical protein